MFESFKGDFPGQGPEQQHLNLVSLTYPLERQSPQTAEITRPLWNHTPPASEPSSPFNWHSTYTANPSRDYLRFDSINTMPSAAYTHDRFSQPPSHRESKGEQIYHYLTEKYHLSTAQACGIIGNMQSESGLRSSAYNNGERAIGLCQWQGARSKHLKQFAAQHGTHHGDWHVQVDFMMHELKGSESFAWSALRRAHTPQQAAVVFDRYYERSSGAARHQRVANATNIYEKAANVWSA
jgi:hypothetical protein